MPLAALADLLSLPELTAYQQVSLHGVTLDSREVRAGDLFAALPGEHLHGAQFAAAAQRAGAVAVLTDRTGADRLALDVPVLTVADPRGQLGEVASAVYGHPSRAMTVAGVTGTNGKTTTCYLLEGAMASAGHTTALLGTIETRLAGEHLPQARTTPEAPQLQALLAVARERGVDAAAMEVSSHALALGRIAGIRFAVGVFTNLSQDHLDFHGTLEEYFAVKASLFRAQMVGRAVICLDDSYGQRLAEQVTVPRQTYTVAGTPGADWRLEDVQTDPEGSSATALGPRGEAVRLRVQMPGRYNLGNALGALAAATCCGLDAAVAAAGIAAVPGVPGRLERIEAGQRYAAFVDFAHTPDAVGSLLDTLRALTPGRLVVVLGCGGDRDRAKRAPMARAAVAGSDLAVLTSDNPRSEDPQQILAQMTDGLSGQFVVEPDRAAAIAIAVQGLGAGDTVVVAGKGHETGQDIGGHVAPFDDRVVLQDAITAGARAC